MLKASSLHQMPPASRELGFGRPPLHPASLRPCRVVSRVSHHVVLLAPSSATGGMGSSSSESNPRSSGSASSTTARPSQAQQGSRQSRPSASSSAPPAADAAATTPVGTFFHKVKLAWRVFFPDVEPQVSAKEEGKRRLRMILVADRCGMSPASMNDMKKNIVRSLSNYVDIDSEEGIEVDISVDRKLGAVYSVAIPVRRVKPEARFGDGEGLEGSSDGITLEWDPEDWNSDPSARFPMGC